MIDVFQCSDIYINISEGKESKKAKDGKIKCKAGEGWIAKPKSLKCVKN